MYHYWCKLVSRLILILSFLLPESSTRLFNYAEKISEKQGTNNTAKLPNAEECIKMQHNNLEYFNTLLYY